GLRRRHAPVALRGLAARGGRRPPGRPRARAAPDQLPHPPGAGRPQRGGSTAHAGAGQAHSERHRSGPFPALQARLAYERLLSMLTVFLGRESMREFGLPARPPWAHFYIAGLNTLRYRTPFGLARL